MMDSMTTTTIAMLLEFAQDGADVVYCDEDIVSKINEELRGIDMGGMPPSSTLGNPWENAVSDKNKSDDR